MILSGTAVLPFFFISGLYNPNLANIMLYIILNIPRGKIMYYFRDDKALLPKLYNDVNKNTLEYVIRVLDEYEYVGSPVYDSQIDRETINQITDRIIDMAMEENDDVAEIVLGRDSYFHNEWILYRSSVEAVMLNELFFIRRPSYFLYGSQKSLT
jgi:hypothetical protein